MMKMSDLPRDMSEEVLSRVPLTSVRRVRTTCRKWNTLSKDRSFAKKHLVHQAKLAAEAKEFMVVAMMDFRVYLMRVNLHKSVESCIKREGKLISIDGSDEVDVSQVFHCEGLLLCVSKDYTRLLVWNPYLGQTRWLENLSYKYFRSVDNCLYALGYEKSSKSRRHKVLVFRDFNVFRRETDFKIYELNSDSWRVLDVTPDGWGILSHKRGFSLKGNTYWVAGDLITGVIDAFLVCFDFTSERFGPRLPLPVEWIDYVPATLSCVREEQLAVLYGRNDFLEVWITSKIEPNAVLWNSKVFLALNMDPRTSAFYFPIQATSFFVDEEKKVAVIFDKLEDSFPNVAHIVGVDGSFKEAHLGESAFQSGYPLVCSYVPSLVQL